jgi:SAM-dependent methyltransferase
MHTPDNTPANRYGSIAAEIYDIDKPYFALPDTAYFLARLARVTGPILEPACGSGRTLVPLLEAGHEAAGFDPSPEMLERCRARCAEKGFAPDLRRQRFEDFAFERRFAAVIVPVATFTLIDDAATALAVLRRLRDAIEPDGVAIIDIAPLASLVDTGDDVRRWTAENGDLLTLHGRRTLTDWIMQRSETLIRYERWRDNRLIETQLEPMSQRYWGLEEFTWALQAAGFTDGAVSGGYADRPPRRGDRVMTFEARRDVN